MPQAGIACAGGGTAIASVLPFHAKQARNKLFRIPPPACKNLPQHKARPSGAAAFMQLWASLWRRPFSFCKKETKTKGR